jgi:hypothetical protein
MWTVSHMQWSVLPRRAEYRSAERLMLATVDMLDWAAWLEGCGWGAGRQAGNGEDWLEDRSVGIALVAGWVAALKLFVEPAWLRPFYVS